MGNMILGVGAHPVRLRGFVAREDDTEISSLIYNGEYLTDLSRFWPAGTKFKKGEAFMFAQSDDVKEVYISAGSINVISYGRYGALLNQLPEGVVLTEDGLNYLITEDGLFAIAYEPYPASILTEDETAFLITEDELNYLQYN